MSDSEKSSREEAVRNAIMTKLAETGERDRLREALIEKLIASGWQEKNKEYIQDFIRRKGDAEKISVEELMTEVIPFGKRKLSICVISSSV